MFDMLFVSVSHRLSPYIFSLNDRCKQLTDKERLEVKEPLDPGARWLLLKSSIPGVVALNLFYLPVNVGAFVWSITT